MEITRDPEAWARLGRAIRAERERQGLTQVDLSERASVSTKSVQDAEAGKVPRARKPYTLAAVEKALGWPAGTIDEVLEGAEPPGTQRRWTQVPADPDTVKAAEAIISGAMLQATDNVTSAEIREVTRIAIKELRRHGMLPSETKETRDESHRNAS